MATEARRTGSLVDNLFFFMAFGEARPFYRPERHRCLVVPCDRPNPFETTRTIRYAGNDRYKLLEGIGCA